MEKILEKISLLFQKIMSLRYIYIYIYISELLIFELLILEQE